MQPLNHKFKLTMLEKILLGAFQDCRVILESAQAGIAVRAEQFSYLSRLVIMVNIKKSFAWIGTRPTDSASTFLQPIHSFKVRYFQTITSSVALAALNQAKAFRIGRSAALFVSPLPARGETRAARGSHRVSPLRVILKTVGGLYFFTLIAKLLQCHAFRALGLRGTVRRFFLRAPFRSFASITTFATIAHFAATRPPAFSLRGRVEIGQQFNRLTLRAILFPLRQQFVNFRIASSQGVDLRRKVAFWSGSLAAQTACGPFVF